MEIYSFNIFDLGPDRKSFFYEKEALEKENKSYPVTSVYVTLTI